MRDKLRWQIAGGLIGLAVGFTAFAVLSGLHPRVSSGIALALALAALLAGASAHLLKRSSSAKPLATVLAAYFLGLSLLAVSVPLALILTGRPADLYLWCSVVLGSIVLLVSRHILRRLRSGV